MKDVIFQNWKKTIFSIFILFLGSLVIIFSPNISTSIYDNMIYILTNKWFIIFTFLAMSFCNLEFMNCTKEVNFVLRSNCLCDYIKKNMMILIKMVCSFFLFSLLLAIIGVLVVHFNDLSINLSVQQICYLLFMIVRTCILLILTEIILYMVSWHFSKQSTILFCLLFIVFLLFEIDIMKLDHINQLFPIPLFVTSYFSSGIFTNFSLELSASIIQVCILSFVIVLLYYNCFKKEQGEKIR